MMRTDFAGDHLRNEETLQGVRAERDILHATDRSNGKRIGHILCRNCLLKHIIVGKKRGENSGDGTTRKKT